MRWGMECRRDLRILSFRLRFRDRRWNSPLASSWANKCRARPIPLEVKCNSILMRLQAEINNMECKSNYTRIYSGWMRISSD
jgi:hypothetical protein